MLKELIREAPIGQFLRYVTNNRILLYPEETPDLILPVTYQAVIEAKESQFSSTQTTPAPTIINSKLERVGDADPEGSAGQSNEELIVPQVTADGTILVDWYTEDDPANPLNWSRGKRATVAAMIVCRVVPSLMRSTAGELTITSVSTLLPYTQAPQSTPPVNPVSS